MNLRKSNINFPLLIVSLLIVYLIAFIGGIFTSGNTSSEWYLSIRPDITPPNWVFPIAWNILYACIAISFYFSFLSSKNKKTKTNLITIFGINLFLNLLWSFLFFSMKNPFLAFINILILFISIIFMLNITKKLNKVSFYLLIPYLLWISFASLLNLIIIL